MRDMLTNTERTRMMNVKRGWYYCCCTGQHQSAVRPIRGSGVRANCCHSNRRMKILNKLHLENTDKRGLPQTLELRRTFAPYNTANRWYGHNGFAPRDKTFFFWQFPCFGVIFGGQVKMSKLLPPAAFPGDLLL